MVEHFEVGEIAGTHGVHGDVKVFPTTDDPDRFFDLTNAYVEEKDGRLRPVTVSKVRVDGKFVVLHLSGTEDMDAARLLRGRKILIDRKDAIKLPEGSYFIADLIGCRVLNEDGRELGVFDDCLRTGANDVYVVKKNDGKELLIPATSECILETNPEEGYLRVHLLPGLEDL